MTVLGGWKGEDADSLALSHTLVTASLLPIYIHMDEVDPEEAVGLVWGEDPGPEDSGSEDSIPSINAHVTRLINQARSAIRFSVSKAFFIELINSVPDSWYLAAIYHSHPAGSLSPSVRDLSSLAAQYQMGLRIPWVIITPYSGWGMWWIGDSTLPTSRTFPHPDGVYAKMLKMETGLKNPKVVANAN